MTDACPFLEYREADAYPTERAYCAAAERFVQPMRADVCNGRHGLDHEADCEIFRAHEGLQDLAGSDADANETETTDGEADP